MQKVKTIPSIDFYISKNPILYNAAMDFMEGRIDGIKNNTENECVWILSHEKVYTAGVSAKTDDVIDKSINVINTNRGGKITYHGPGQKICYLIIDLKKRGFVDVREYVQSLEDVIIQTLSDFEIIGEKRKDRIGIWVQNNQKEEKIAAIGVRFSKGIAFHGFAININPKLEDFNAIIPCGISAYGVCSVESLGKKINDEQFEISLIKNIESMLV